ncbi:MAG: hypothetical protein ACFB21_07785 [Opitutales bacterium]
MRFCDFGEFLPTGDLWTRLCRNYARLEEETYYPENVFKREGVNTKWPGDAEGRTLLAWVLLGQATGRAPRYLAGTLARWPHEVNEAGYFGRQYSDGISEQQLSGHGWVLQALAELERWLPEGPAWQRAQPIIDNLFLPTADAYAQYSIDPSQREAAGEYSGSHLKQLGPWILSTDVGCFAVGMAGLIDACEAFGQQTRLKTLIEAMLGRFLAIDLVTIQAQTHATLTGCRALLRWARLTRQADLVDEVAKRFELFTATAWSETYANFNWFDRPKWTEPCAVVDALMVAMELWRLTSTTTYLQQAQVIWFNALGHGQRANGGFGCDNCPGADGSTELAFSVPEAHWCCTMRGAEGLARMTQYCAAREGDSLFLPFGLPGDYMAGESRLSVHTSYPRNATWHLANGGSEALPVALFLPPWIAGIPERGDDGWLRLTVPAGEVVEINGHLTEGERPLLPPTTRFAEQHGVSAVTGQPLAVRYRGPLLLADYGGGDWRPIADDFLRHDLRKETSAKTLLTPLA